MLQILSTSNETSTGAELVQNGNFSEIGSDLVTNGDFSAAGSNLVSNPNFTDTGSELVVNGTFVGVANGTDVITLSGWSAYNTPISRNVESERLEIVTSGSNEGAKLSITTTIGKSYKLQYTATGDTGAQGIYISGISGVNTSTETTFYFVAIATTTTINFRAGTNSAGTTYYDDISVKELGADWTITNADTTHYVEFVETGARYYSLDAGVSALSLNQLAVPVSGYGKSYKLTCTCTFTSGTNIRFYSGSLNVGLLTEGVNTLYFVADSNQTIAFIRNANTLVDVTISSISVQELGEGWSFVGVDATNTISIESGGARVNSVDTNISLRQTILDIGKSYKLTCNTAITTGKLGLDSSTAGTTTNLIEGANVVYFKAVSETFSIKRVDAITNVLIDNITVQELDPNGYWTIVGSGLTIGEDKGIYTDAGVGSYFKNTSFVVVDGKTYRGSFDIPELTEGGLSWQTALGTVSISPNYGAADTGLTFDFVGDGSTGIKCIGTTLDNTSAITNLSVKLLGTYDDQSIYVTAADVQTIAQASVYYLVELTSMASRNSLYFLPSSVVPNNGRYTKLNFTVISKDALPQPTVGIISFYDSVGGFDTYPMGFYEFRIYEQTSSTNLDPLLATGLLEKGFAFVRDFSGNMQELTDGFKEYNPTLTQYVYSK
jgi:hypothetical protein